MGLAALAGRAAAAGGQPAHQDAVALGEPGDAVADVEDLPGALVPGDEGGGLRQHPVHGGEIGVAQSGRPDPDPDLAGSKPHRLDVVEDFELVLPCLVLYGCAHVTAPLVRTAIPPPSGPAGANDASHGVSATSHPTRGARPVTPEGHGLAVLHHGVRQHRRLVAVSGRDRHLNPAGLLPQTDPQRLPGKTTPAKRVVYDRTRVTSPPSTVSTTALSVTP